MKQLRAFVGHSFDDQDQQLVRSFQDYFDSLKGTIDFEWDHAKRAEPRELCKKVKAKMEGKNLFIGIFTKKDFRIAPDKLEASEAPEKKCLSDDDLTWVPSNWIIQESGYALGKDMDVIFAVENGVDLQTGLQGDIEYVPFERSNLGPCYTKINEMLGSLAKEARTSTSEQVVRPSTDTKEEEEEEKVREPKEEKIEQEKERKSFPKRFRSLRKTILEDKDLARAKKIVEEAIEWDKGREDSDAFWRTWFHFLKTEAGYSDALQEFEDFAKGRDNDPYPTSMLGSLYKNFEHYLKAAEKFLLASQGTKEKNDKIEYISQASECYALDGNFEKAYNVLENEFQNDNLDRSNTQKLLYGGLAKIAKLEKNDNLFVSFSEKALNLIPTDHQIRFSLAYHYDEVGNHALALYHYKTLCERAPNGTNWNNLGVAYEQLQMSHKSVDAYDIASSRYDETLAMANLAYKYIGAGFLLNASEILKKARTIDDYHSNVDGALSRINEVKKAETEREKKELKATNRERGFMVEFAEAYAVPSQLDIEAMWESKHGNIRLEVKGSSITGGGETTIQEVSGLLPALAGLQKTPTLKTKKVIKLDGTIHNRTIEYEMSITRTPDSAALIPKGTLLGGTYPSRSKYKGIMYVHDDSQRIKVMETAESEAKPSFYVMKRSSG